MLQLLSSPSPIAPTGIKNETEFALFCSNSQVSGAAVYGVIADKIFLQDSQKKQNYY